MEDSVAREALLPELEAVADACHISMVDTQLFVIIFYGLILHGFWNSV